MLATVPSGASQLLSTRLRGDEKHSQVALPVDVSLREIQRLRSFGRAITYTYEAAGFDTKVVTSELRVDKGQMSRWESETEGVKWGKLRRLMDMCGNEAVVLWMAHDVGFDITSMHKRETETERENRMLREENAALRRALKAAA